MSAPAALEQELTADPKELPGVRQTLRGWLTERGWTDDTVEQIVLAVDEALANVIRHGYGGPCDKRILLAVHALEDPARGPGIEISLRDFGQQIDPQKICGRDLDDVRPGGLGVHIIRTVMDEAEYSRARGGGMQLVMRKYRVGTADNPAHGSDPQ